MYVLTIQDSVPLTLDINKAQGHKYSSGFVFFPLPPTFTTSAPSLSLLFTSAPSLFFFVYFRTSDITFSFTFHICHPCIIILHNLNTPPIFNSILVNQPLAFFFGTKYLA
ncbi:hypothetical protein Hanom_Chr06g00500111 [Helianthus anomalus]